MKKKTGVLVFALALEAQHTAVEFRRTGVKLQTRNDLLFPFSTTNTPIEWHGVVCGPGKDFPFGLEKAMAQLQSAPSLVILAGFSGGLSPEAKPGSIWAADTIVCETGAITLPLLFPPNPENPIRSGTALYSENPLCTPMSKSEAKDRFKADIVDMESWVFATRMNSRHVPYAVLRAVSDGPGDGIPQEVCLWTGSNGKIHIPRVIFGLFRNPGLILKLPGLASGAKLAGKTLGRALSLWVQQEPTGLTTTAFRP